MIAACDTFRSGAVEQLKTHCVRLGVPLYERGYEKDPAKVALEAQRAAERNRKDVLLVDTAGEPFLAPPALLQHAAEPCIRWPATNVMYLERTP
jgi:signal recognition particle receptor subunit alpha